MGTGGKPLLGSRAVSKCRTRSSRLGRGFSCSTGPRARARSHTDAAQLQRRGRLPLQLSRQLRAQSPGLSSRAPAPAVELAIRGPAPPPSHPRHRAGGQECGWGREGPSWAGHPRYFSHSTQSPPSPSLPEVTAQGSAAPLPKQGSTWTRRPGMLEVEACPLNAV